MTYTESQTGRYTAGSEVLTLAETAAYLRVPEEAVRKLVDQGDLPAQPIGEEFRFLKQAVVEWLRFGPQRPRELGRLPASWMLDHPFWEELCWALEQRILSKLPASERTAPKPGSKQAVLKHFGVFKEDGDIEEQLARIRTSRESGE
jgi:excisionase family DNA binding protein